FGNLAPGGYAWIIPKSRCANVGLGTWQHFHGNLRELFDRFVQSRHLEPGKATGGFVPVLGPPPRTVKDNAMLVGDAAGMGTAAHGAGDSLPTADPPFRCEGLIDAGGIDGRSGWISSFSAARRRSAASG